SGSGTAARIAFSWFVLQPFRAPSFDAAVQMHFSTCLVTVRHRAVVADLGPPSAEVWVLARNPVIDGSSFDMDQSMRIASPSVFVLLVTPFGDNAGVDCFSRADDKRGLVGGQLWSFQPTFSPFGRSLIPQCRREHVEKVFRDFDIRLITNEAQAHTQTADHKL